MWVIYTSLLLLALVAHVALCAVVSYVAPPPVQNIVKDTEEEDDEDVPETGNLLQAPCGALRSSTPQGDPMRKAASTPRQAASTPRQAASTPRQAASTPTISDKISDDGWEPLEVLESQV